MQEKNYGETSMDYPELVKQRRTIRRFTQDKIPTDMLKKLVDYARIAPTGGNNQSLSYIIINDPETREKIFPLLRWAASLPERERTPPEGKRPMAYIIVLNDMKARGGGDFAVGAAVENILLGAVFHGLGACWMGAIDRKKIQKTLDIPKQYEIKHVISLGHPAEESIMEPYEGSCKYWKDEEGKMHVPKRSLDDVIFKIIE